MMNKTTLKILFLLIFIFSISIAKNQTIPNERTVNWKLISQSFDFEYQITEINILDFGATGDGITDDYQAVNNAILSLNENGGIIYFPEGNYLIKSAISLTEGIVLKGTSSQETSLIFDLNKSPINCINISKSQTSEFVEITSGLLKGDTKLSCSQSDIFEGVKFAEIIQDNGDWDIVPINWAENSVGQIIRIENIIDDTIFFNNPLRIDYSSELNPRIRPIFPIEKCAVECLKIKRLDVPDEGAGSNISFNFAANCKVIGVESDSSVGSHIAISSSTNLKIKGNYIHHAFTFDGVGTRGYGISLSQHSGECQIENNIFKHLRHAMMIKTGSNGNIFGYNYSCEPVRSEQISDLSGDISFHGHYAFANLFEGNIIQNIIIDHYWGPSGPYNTLFRNRAELYGILMTTNDLAETGFQNFVGNETTNDDFLKGQYVLSGENHFEFGNNILGSVIPTGTENLSDTSYYLSEKPIFWKNNINWPSIGLPNAGGKNIIPAKQRYLDGNILTVCSDSTLTYVSNNKTKKEIIIWPNPASKIAYFKSNYSGEHKVKIIDLNGKLVFSESIFAYGNTMNIDVSSIRKNGLYFIIVQNNKETLTSKILIRN